MSIAAASLILDYGGSDVEVVGASMGDIYGLLELNLPLVVFENEFATSPDTEGGKRVRSTPQNSEGSLRVRVIADDANTFWGGVTALEEVTAKLHRDGGAVRYVPPDGNPVIFDVEAAAISELPTDASLALYRAQPVIAFTCLPFGRLDPETLVAAASFSSPLADVEVPEPSGSALALGKLTVTDLEGQGHDWVEYGFEDDYDASSPAPLLLVGTDLPIIGFAGAGATRSGAYGAGAPVRRAALISYPVAICGTGAQGHTGRWQPFVRVFGTGSGPIYVRLSRRTGSARMEHGEWVQLPQLGAWTEVNLGLVEIDKANVGAQGWEGWIEAYTETIGDSLDVNYLGMMPASRYGLLTRDQRTEYSAAPLGRDEFDQSAGDLNGKALPDGSGNWSTSGGSGDFTVDATNHVAARTASGESVLGGRYALGPTDGVAACVLRGDIFFSATPNGSLVLAGIVRYSDANNWLRFALAPRLGIVTVQKRVAGTLTTLAVSPASGGSAFYKLKNVWYSAIIAVDERGNWNLQGGVKGSGFVELLSGQDNDLATGGALEAGKVGLYDEYVGSGTVTRRYDNVIAFAGVAAPHIINAERSLVIDADRADSEPVSDLVWTPATPEGVYPRLIPGQVTRLAVRVRRENVRIGSADDVTDSTKLDLVATPRVLLLG